MASEDQQTILVIEDEDMVGEMLARYLKRDGYRGLVATNSEEAMAVLRRTRVHMALLDIKLGDEDGFEVFKTIKEEHPDLPVVMLTGLGYEEKAMHDALELGAAGYLSKSADVSEVGITVRRILGSAVRDPEKSGE
jgi:DNA-binding response OmpR family regulator